MEDLKKMWSKNATKKLTHILKYSPHPLSTYYTGKSPVWPTVWKHRGFAMKTQQPYKISLPLLLASFWVFIYLVLMSHYTMIPPYSEHNMLHFCHEYRNYFTLYYRSEEG